jgi:hypothetical protein
MVIVAGRHYLAEGRLLVRQMSVAFVTQGDLLGIAEKLEQIRTRRDEAEYSLTPASARGL